MNAAQSYVLSDLSVMLMIGVPLALGLLLWYEGRNRE